MNQNEKWSDIHNHTPTGSSKFIRDASLSSDVSPYLSGVEYNQRKSAFLRGPNPDVSSSSSEVPPLHPHFPLHHLSPCTLPLPWGAPPPPQGDDPLKKGEHRTLNGDDEQKLSGEKEHLAENSFSISPQVQVTTNSFPVSDEGGVQHSTSSPALSEALLPSERNHEREANPRRAGSHDRHYSSHHRSHSYHDHSFHHFHRYTPHSSFSSHQKEDPSYRVPSLPHPPPLSPPPPSPHHHSCGIPFSTATPPPPLFRSSPFSSPTPRSISGNDGDAKSWKIPSCAPELVIPEPWKEGSSITFSESLLMDLLAAAVARGGPMVEEEVAKREETNPSFAFLQVEWRDARSHYYRWRLYSLLQGDTLTSWRTTPFQLVAEADAYVWKPPPAILSASDYLLFASRGDTLSTLASSVSWIPSDGLEHSTPTTTTGSLVTPIRNGAPPTHSCVHPTVDSAHLLRLPVTSAWRIAREIPERYRRMIQLLKESDAKNWKAEVHLTSRTPEEEMAVNVAGWWPPYSSVFHSFSPSSSSSFLTSAATSPAQVTEEALDTHWKAWLQQWYEHTFSSSSIGGKMVRGIELADGGAAAEHVLCILLDEVLRVAFENGAFLRQLMKKEKTRESVWTPLGVVEEAAAACSSHCLQLQWYLFLLHDILSNAAMAPMREEEEVMSYVKKRKKREKAEAERRKKSTSSPAGMKEETGASEATLGNVFHALESGPQHGEPHSRSPAELPTLIQFPPTPSLEKSDYSSVAAALKGRYQRRVSWSRALETVLIGWIEATSLVVMNTLYISGNLKAYPVETDLSGERGWNGSSAGGTFTQQNSGVRKATEGSGGSGMEECTIESLQAEGDDSRKVKIELSTAAWSFLHPFSPSANPTAAMTNTSRKWNTNSALSSASSSPCLSSLCAPLGKSSGNTLHRQEFFQVGSDKHILRLSSILERNMLEIAMMLLSWLRFLLLQWREDSFKGNTLEKDLMEELDDDEGNIYGYCPSKRPRERKTNGKPLLSLRMYSKMLERYPFLHYESS